MVRLAREANVAIAVLVVGSGVAHGEVITITSMRDNTLYDDGLGVTSNGAGNHFFAGNTAEPRARRGLLAFDVPGSIPAGSTILDVSLVLHMSRTIGGPADVALHPLLADWGEGASMAPGEEGAGAPAEPGDATWINTFFDTDDWANAGGDFGADPSATTTIGNVAFYTWGSTAALVADVQGWLDGAGNFGWLLLGDESGPFTAKRFDTRENPIGAFRPMLTVEYATPTPATLPLLLASLLTLGRTRRR